MSKPMKVFWLSNSGLVSSGYGNQTALFCSLMKERGIDIMTRAFYGHRGHVMSVQNIPILPGTYDDLGQDAIVSDYKRHRPDVFVILYDMWAYKSEVLRQVPITAYAPIDHQPAPPQVIDRLHNCRWLWAMSRSGEREMRRAGLDPFYVPHGVDTDTFKPVDRAVARRKWMVGDDQFLVVMNAANKGFPSRKSIDKVIKAWGVFIETHPNAILHLHTHPHPTHMGFDIRGLCEFYNVPDTNVRVADPDRLRDGEYTDSMINDLYNAADVLLAPSAGEGFGIPVIESQAAGCPVIVTDFSAQTELCGAGYKIPIDRLDDLYYTQQCSEQAWVRPSAILTALEWAYEQRGNNDLRTKAREFAMDYDFRRVFDQHMLPALKLMAQGNADLRIA